MLALIGFAITIHLLSSCGNTTEEIDWETENIPSKLVVEGNVTNQIGNHPITLTYSDPYFANQPPRPVKNASVLVMVENTRFSYAERADMPGVYESTEQFSGKPGAFHTLNIELNEAIDGEKSYSAQSKMPMTFIIDTIEAQIFTNPMGESEEDKQGVLMLVTGKEEAHVKNYYYTKFYRNSKCLDDTVTNLTIFSDSDLDADGKEYLLLSTSFLYNTGDTLGLELCSISEHYHRYITACKKISIPADPFGFSSPPADAQGNVNNGKALGYFYATMVSKGKTVVLSDENE